MSSGMFVLSGTLCRDCEVRFTASQKAVCSFSLPMDVGWGDNKTTQWVEFVILGKRAESKLPEYLLKGQGIYVTGEPSIELWAKKDDGSPQGKIKVVVREINLVGPKPQSAPQQQQQAQSQQPQPTPSGGFDDFDDDIPF